jgi:hypothetical protein
VSAFAAAAAVLASDANIGADATYTPAGGGASLAVRVIPTRPQEPIGAMDGPRSIAVAASVVIAASAVTAPPARGAALVFGGVAYTVAEVMLDEIAASYTLNLRRAPPPPPPSP